MVKRLHSGRAAQSGVYAALLAKRGFTGILDVVEAPYGGFLSSFSRQPDYERITAGLNTKWETLQIGFKMYPKRHQHSLRARCPAGDHAGASDSRRRTSPQSTLVSAT